jgi:hypothetical protein
MTSYIKEIITFYIKETTTFCVKEVFRFQVLARAKMQHILYGTIIPIENYTVTTIFNEFSLGLSEV